MKRFHVHVGVSDLRASIGFYTALFGTDPSVAKDDYAKWMLDDPRVNFAISTRSKKPGLNHLGIQAESNEELAQLHARVTDAQLPVASQDNANCCYARSDKHWTIDPANIAWESFHTLNEASAFGEALPSTTELKRAASACCIPLARKSPEANSCCVPAETTSCCK